MPISHASNRQFPQAVTEFGCDFRPANRPDLTVESRMGGSNPR